MIYAIASYHRPACRTIRTLRECGVSDSDIVVSLQDKNDVPDYRKNYPEIRFIFRETDCAAGNRNTLLDSIKERPLCLLDDDITSFSVFTFDTGFLVNKRDGIEKIDLLAKRMEENNCGLGGFVSTNNNIIARNRPELTTDNLLQGTVLVVADNNIRFDENWKMVEDYELSLRMIYKGFHLLRDNYSCAEKPKNATNEGGMHERYMNNELPMWLKRLQKKYPLFKANKNLTGGSIVWK